MEDFMGLANSDYILSVITQHKKNGGHLLINQLPNLCYHSDDICMFISHGLEKYTGLDLMLLDDLNYRRQLKNWENYNHIEIFNSYAIIEGVTYNDDSNTILTNCGHEPIKFNKIKMDMEVRESLEETYSRFGLNKKKYETYRMKTREFIFDHLKKKGLENLYRGYKRSKNLDDFLNEQFPFKHKK